MGSLVLHSLIRFSLILAVLSAGCDNPASQRSSGARQQAAGPGDLSPPTRQADNSNDSEPDKTISALVTAYELQSTGRYGPKFLQMLNDAKPRLNELVVPPDEPSRWHRVTLNTSGACFDAIRVRSQLKGPGDLLWSFTTGSETGLRSWQIVSENGVVAGSQGAAVFWSDCYSKHDVVFAGVDLPAESIVVLDETSDGQFKSEVDYYFCFVFANARPTDFYFKLKFVTPDTHGPANTIYTLAEKLDFQLPFQFSSAASLEARVFDVFAYQGPEAAKEFIAVEADQGVTPRKIHYVRAWVLQKQALQLSEEGKERDARPLFLEAANACRALRRQAYGLSEYERELCALVFYNEACVLCLADEYEKAIASLREALEFGLDGLDNLSNDPDLAALRETDEFQQLLKAISQSRALIGPRLD